MTKVDGYVIIENLSGVITYIIRENACETTSLDSVFEKRGAATQLVGRVISRAHELGCSALRLLTTNDNLNAIGFYQKRGFNLFGINIGAMDREREQKPTIPVIGQNGIPVHHEIEFCMDLQRR
jgi:N-acetylglutamate synthase-like GNAT family acetyltransferase